VAAPVFNAASMLPREAVERFAALYPAGQDGGFRHNVSGHPLLTPQALAQAALRMDPATVQIRAGNARNGEGFDFGEDTGKSISEIICGIAEAGRWVMLAKLEQLPEYDALLHEIMAPLEPAIRSATGEPLRLRGYAFVQSPGVVTPFHLDPEYNIMFHIAGAKDFAVYPMEEPWLSEAVNEYYHKSGDNLLAWQGDYRAMGTIYRLEPGDALYVPYKRPHWVEVCNQPAVSLSLTWCTKASYEQEAAWRLNAWLKVKGLAFPEPAPLPARSRLRALAWSALDRLRLT
jgi:hypothetical protein